MEEGGDGPAIYASSSGNQGYVPLSFPLEAEMKKVLICAALVALAAGTASAAGLNLGWNECPSGGSYLHDMAFACTSNSGAEIIIGSYIPPAGLLEVNGNEMVLDLQTNQAALSPWWNMGTASGCVGRTTTPVLTDFGFASLFGCTDYWGPAGGASGGGGYLPAYGGPNRARIVMVAAILEANATALDPGTEYYSFKVIISNARTVGSPNCPGCTDAACIVLNSIKITQNVSQSANPTVTNPAVSNFVTWRGGLGNCQVTPARNTTWGSVKALYR